MMLDKAFVIGDMFQAGLGSGSMLTLQEAFQNINQGCEYRELYIGQGLNLTKADQFAKKVKSITPETKVLIPKYLSDREIKKFVHQHNDENVLITTPQLKEGKYSNYLILDNSNLIKDHTTGLHMQGMVLMEAARQTPISIIERFIYRKGNNLEFKMILSEMQSFFKRYVLPQEIIIKTRVTIHEQTEKKISLSFLVEMHQYQKECAAFSVAAICLPSSKVEHIEHKNIKASFNNIPKFSKKDVEYFEYQDDKVLL